MLPVPLLRRLCLLLAGVFYLAILAGAAAGQWLLARPEPEWLGRGAGWTPGNAALRSAYARALSDPMDDSTLPGVVAAFEESLARNPFDIFVWDELATAYSRQGNSQRAEAALRASVAFIPNFPATAWRLGNFLVLQGRTAEALPLLQRAATYDQSLRFPAFDLAWKLLGDPAVIFEEVVPGDLQGRLDYVHFLISQGRLLEAYPAWQAIHASAVPPVIAVGREYAGVLAANNLGTEAATVWKDTLELTGTIAPQPRGNLMTNGDFEQPLQNAGLDWRLGESAGFRVALDSFTARSGSRSLRVTFDGTSNVAFYHVQQWVPVEPNRRYRFRAGLKTDNISTDQGVFLFITPVAAEDEQRWQRRSEDRHGTVPWTQEQLEFTTGPETTVIVVELRREPSARVDNLLQGKVWLDDVLLEPLDE